MDSIHDLGGKQGYGPIEVDEPEVPFKYEWEGRIWGLVCCYDAPDWTIDWWRHIRETIDPQDYLNRPYFDSWTQTQMAGYIDSGILTLDEIKSGVPVSVSDIKPDPITVETAIEEDRSYLFSFELPIDSEPQFSVGESITTNLHGSSHHTRLPAYARGKVGRIHTYHGAHVFPDASAQGKEEPGHLYTVAFETGELWPDSKHPGDVVHLDLWENYLNAS